MLIHKKYKKLNFMNAQEKAVRALITTMQVICRLNSGLCFNIEEVLHLLVESTEP